MVKIFLNNVLNVHPDEKQRWILVTSVVINLLLAYICPIMSKTLFTDLPARWFSVESIVFCLSSLMVGTVWRGRFRRSVVKFFALFCITESLVGFGLGCYLAFVCYNSWVFVVASLIYNSMITTVVMKAIMVFKSQLWNEEKREVYDNNCDIVANIVCLGGYVVSLVYMPTIATACFLWGLCCLIDNLGWLYVYFKWIRGCFELEK